MKANYDYLIWDFNGTILDDIDAGITAANRLLTAHGLPTIASRKAYRAVFGFPIIDYYRRLGFDFDKLPYDELAVEWVDYYLKSAETATLCPDVEEVLSAARERGVSQWILSATEQQMLTEQIRSLGILPYFDGILGLDNIHAYSKQEIGISWRREHPTSRVLMIGDTDHDAGVARAMGIDYVLVTTGHQNREALENAHPLFVADSAREILGIL